MFARFVIVFFLTAIIAFNSAVSQEQPGTFDPVIYMKMISMGERYSDSRFLNRAHTVSAFENYMIDKADVIAFTLKVQDSSGAGWTMWLDFAMDRLGGKRLIKLFAQKPAGKNPGEAYTKLFEWLEVVLIEKLGEVLEEKPDLRRLAYEGAPGYELTVRLTPPQDDGLRYLTIGVKEVSGN